MMNSLPEPLQQIDRTCVLWRGRRLAYFGGCDYFRLASHPAVLRAMQIGLEKYGLNVAASRKTTGNHRLHGELEKALAAFFGGESALLVSNGYLTNLAVAQALAGDFSHVLIDARAHGCLVDAAVFFDCPVITFSHRDCADLRRILQRLGRSARPILLTDGMFSHDGSVAPLREQQEILPRDAWMLVDDAHGAGILGRRGRGTVELAGIRRERVIQTMTLSKALGVYGGAILGSRQLRGRIIARSRVFVGGTPLPLPLANAALTAVKVLKANAGWRTRLHRRAAGIKAALRDRGWSLPDAPGPIIPFVPRDEREAAALKRKLLAAGIHPPFIHYPGGPENGQFRFVISSEHTGAQLAALVKVLSA